MELTYCAPCGYLPTALEVTKQFLGHFRQEVETFSLVPGEGGVFEVRVDGKLVFSKAESGRLPDPQEVLDTVEPGG